MPRALTRAAPAEPAPPVLASERARLAEAIERRDAARAELARFRDAEQRAMQARIAASADADKAEALLDEARSSAPHSYVHALLDGGDGSTSPVAEAERRLDAAQAELRRHREGAEALAL